MNNTLSVVLRNQNASQSDFLEYMTIYKGSLTQITSDLELFHSCIDTDIESIKSNRFEEEDFANKDLLKVYELFSSIELDMMANTTKCPHQNITLKDWKTITSVESHNELNDQVATNLNIMYMTANA
jgi:hypothetical protein